MGEVRLAFEKSSGLEVVIKFVRTDILGVNPGAVLERFTREARFLARVQHPNVVRIYGYGADGTRPFIIMERVRGGSIFGSDPDRPVAPKKAASYIRQAALGLHVAHKYRIIHRDIKPDNLMVECDGTVKVIDFGLAKPLGADQTLTLEGQAIGTPAYMAPEQIASPDRIDARTDVYGLGATLYRLITGVKPFLGGHIGSVFSAIQKRDPLRPRIRNPSVDRDLEAICLKCLHKEPYRRYQSAHELAEDLGNYLDGRPVSARLTRAPERFIYWCRRNPAKAVLYTAIVLLIATVLATTYWSLTARAEAETARAVSGSMNDFWLNRILGQADPEHNPADARITVREALDRASEQLNSDQYSAPHPVVLAELHGAVGEVYRSVGVHDRAEIHIQKSLDLHSSLNGPNQPGALTARHNLAALYIDMGRAAEAEQLYRGVLAVRQSKLGRDHTDTLLTIDQLALALERQQDPTKFDEAERLLRQNLEDRTKLQGRGHEDTLDTMLALANLLIKRQKWGEAEPFLTECHTEMRLVRGPKHPRCVAATNSLIELLRHQGKKDEMVRMSAQNLGDAVAAYGKEHPQALVHRHSHAEKLFDAGSIKESEAMLRETLELQTRPGASTDPNDLALTRHSLGRVLLESGKPVEAEPLLREALKQRLASSPRNWVTGNTQFYLGRCLVKLKRYAEAERELIQAHEILQSSEGVPPKRRRMVVEELIELYSAWGRQDVAEEWKKRLLPSD
jgi:tetratricopeptide (TPR) repeat protein